MDTPLTDKWGIDDSGHCNDDNEGQAVIRIRRVRSLERHARGMADLLPIAIEKLQIYRNEYGGKYIGGMEFGALIQVLNNELVSWRAFEKENK